MAPRQYREHQGHGVPAVPGTPGPWRPGSTGDTRTMAPRQHRTGDARPVSKGVEEGRVQADRTGTTRSSGRKTRVDNVPGRERSSGRRLVSADVCARCRLPESAGAKANNNLQPLEPIRHRNTYKITRSPCTRRITGDLALVYTRAT